MFSNNIEVDILVNGKPVRQYSHQGKLFIESKNSTEYSIRLRNNSWTRKKFVVSVDGINVIDGELGDEKGIGYVLHGLSSYEIKGFRVSNDTVNAFKFTNNKEESYAAKSDVTQGDTKNCGVIGVMVYEEKVKLNLPVQVTYTYRNNITDPPSSPTWNDNITYSCSAPLTRGTSDMAGANLICNYSPDFEQSKGFDMGTEFSQKAIEDKVEDTMFEVSYRSCSFTIYYASREALIEMGIPIVKEAKISLPNPFPSKFCRPPR